MSEYLRFIKFLLNSPIKAYNRLKNLNKTLENKDNSEKAFAEFCLINLPLMLIIGILEDLAGGNGIGLIIFISYIFLKFIYWVWKDWEKEHLKNIGEKL